MRDSSLRSKQPEGRKILYLYISPCFGTSLHFRPFSTIKVVLVPDLAKGVPPVRTPVLPPMHGCSLLPGGQRSCQALRTPRKPRGLGGSLALACCEVDLDRTVRGLEGPLVFLRECYLAAAMTIVPAAKRRQSFRAVHLRIAPSSPTVSGIAALRGQHGLRLRSGS